MSEKIVGNVTSVESQYHWEIPNFRSYAGYETGQCFYSTCFQTRHDEKNSRDTMDLQWQLKFYPNGRKEEDNGYMSMYLLNSNDFKVTAKYSLKIMAPGNYNSSISKTTGESMIFLAKGSSVNQTSNTSQSWGWCKFAEKEAIFSEQSLFIANDALTISCSILEASKNSNDQESVDVSAMEESNRFENLLETGKFGDVTFNIGEKKMQLHKAILVGASAVFQAMFDHEMKEQKDSVVNIVDIDFDAIKEMFRYIYAKKVNGIENIAGNLFIAADKYCLVGLKNLCEKTLANNLNAGNALQCLELAVKYDVKKLKFKTIEFVVKNLKDIVKTQEFLALSPECKNELLINIANNQKSD